MSRFEKEVQNGWAVGSIRQAPPSKPSVETSRAPKACCLSIGNSASRNDASTSGAAATSSVSAGRSTSKTSLTSPDVIRDERLVDDASKRGKRLRASLRAERRHRHTLVPPEHTRGARQVGDLAKALPQVGETVVSSTHGAQTSAPPVWIGSLRARP